LSKQTLEQLEIRVLDAIGVAIAALTAPPIIAIGAFMDKLGGRRVATRMGGIKTGPSFESGVMASENFTGERYQAELK
jgi:2-methylcitrate dehydratase